MSDKKSVKDVVTISGSVWNDNLRMVANAVNYNAHVLKNAMDRITELERQLATFMEEKKG